MIIYEKPSDSVITPSFQSCKLIKAIRMQKQSMRLEN